jgi:hypothetical protein
MRAFLIRLVQLTWVGVGFLIGYGIRMLWAGDASNGLLIAAVVCLTVGLTAWGLSAVMPRR